MYKYKNINPRRKRVNDCVTRAITLGLNENYKTISQQLRLVSELYQCSRLNVKCYEKLLEDVYGAKEIETPNPPKTIKEISTYYPIGTYIIRIHGHLTCMIDSVIYDIWNCENRKVVKIWKIN